MKTVPFSDILAQVCQLSGLDRTTLNDKSFGAVRDMCARRISIIWDREEWPDAEYTLNTFPGSPITGVTTISSTATKMVIRLALDPMFPRVYLAYLDGEAYRQNTIGSGALAFPNPFYILQADSTRVAVENKASTFTYQTATGERGLYITSIDITVPLGTVEYPSTYGGVNAPLTTKVVFGQNPQNIIQIEAGMLQGLQVFGADYRNTTRTSQQSFLVEEFPDISDLATGGSLYQKEVSYLRFRDTSEKYIRYRVVCPRLFGKAFNLLNTYSAGSQVYFDPVQGTGDYNPTIQTVGTRGDFWTAIANVPLGNTPTNTSMYWKMEQIPYRFKDYLINGISADFLRSEGRADEANILDQLAETSIQQQIDVLLRQQGQVQRMNMVYTY